MTAAGPTEWTVFWTVVALALAVDIRVARNGDARPLGSTQLCGVVYGSASVCFSVPGLRSALARKREPPI